MTKSPSAVHPVGKLSFFEKAAYGCGDLASNFYWQMFAIFIAKYYTDVFQLGAVAMGTMLLVTRIGDAFVDPIIGASADRTRTRWGSFRPYLLFMALPLAVTAVATFTVPQWSGGAKLLYAYVTLGLMMIAYSAINIPYSALLGVLTSDSTDRTSALAFRFVMAMLPIFIIVNATIPLAKYFGGSENSPLGWQAAMAVYAAVAVILFVLAFAYTRERVKSLSNVPMNLGNDIKDLVNNRPWKVLCVVGVVALTFGNLRAAVSIFYFENVMPAGRDLFGPFMTSAAVAFMVGVMIASPLSRRFGKKNLYLASTVATVLATAAFYFVPPDNVPMVWFANTLVSLVVAPTAPLIWAMYADTADYSAWKNGRRATGLVFSAASFSQKLGWALGGAGVGWLLGFFHYQPGTVPSQATLHGIVLMMSLIPAAVMAVAGLALLFYPLNENLVKHVAAELHSDQETSPS